jgi:hypothetical protein
VDAHVPAVQLDQSLHHRQADPEPALHPAERAGRLREQIEDVRQHVVGEADAVVAHLHDDVPVDPLDPHVDPSADRGIRRGVREEVREDLQQAVGIAVHEERLGGDGDVQRVAVPLDEGPGALDGPIQHVLDGDGRAAEQRSCRA